MTKVSIITPVFNSSYENCLRSEASILSQTSKDFEWIIVDDGSTEWHGTYDIRLDKNYGPSVARNAGFQISSGDIITYLDMGDELAPDRVESIIKNFTSYDVEIVFCGYY